MKKYYQENPEERQKNKERQKKRFKNPEERQKCSEAQKKRFENPEERQKSSEVKKKYYEENPEAKKKYGEKMKKYYEENPEARKKMSYIKSKNKPFDILRINGEIIKTFNYQYDAKEYLQKEHNITTLIKIGEVLSGKRKSSAGFVFKYK